jgi:hypothetical protein
VTRGGSKQTWESQFDVHGKRIKLGVMMIAFSNQMGLSIFNTIGITFATRRLDDDVNSGYRVSKN